MNGFDSHSLIGRPKTSQSALLSKLTPKNHSSRKIPGSLLDLLFLAGSVIVQSGQLRDLSFFKHLCELPKRQPENDAGQLFIRDPSPAPDESLAKSRQEKFRPIRFCASMRERNRAPEGPFANVRGRRGPC